MENFSLPCLIITAFSPIIHTTFVFLYTTIRQLCFWFVTFFCFSPEEDSPELTSIANLPLFVCELPPQHSHWQTSGVDPRPGIEPRPLKWSVPNLTTRPLGLALQCEILGCILDWGKKTYKGIIGTVGGIRRWRYWNILIFLFIFFWGRLSLS